MEEEETRDYKEPCPQCTDVNWGISDEGKFYCRSCHTVIEKTKEVDVSDTFSVNAKMQSISRGLKRKKKTEKGWNWYLCEGFQFILLKQAEALQGLGVDSRIKDEVMCHFWRCYLQRKNEAYKTPLPSRETKSDGGATGSEVDSELEAFSIGSNSENETTHLTDNSDMPSSGENTSASEHAVSAQTGSVDGGLYRKRRRFLKMSMPVTLAFCYLSLLWLRESITLSDLLRLVMQGHIPYMSPEQYLPEEIKLYGLDIRIFQVQGLSDTMKDKIAARNLPNNLDLLINKPVLTECIYWVNKSASVPSLLDTGAAGCFMDAEFAASKNIPLLPLASLLAVEAIDGRPLQPSPITHETALLTLRVGTLHTETLKFQSFPRYKDIMKKAFQIGTYLKLPLFPPITENCFFHPSVLCMKYLMEANLPDELHNWTYRVAKKAGRNEAKFLTFNPKACCWRQDLVPYDVQAVALIIVVLKLLFLLDNKYEWLLSNIVEERNQKTKGNPCFDFRKWYKTMKSCLDEAQQKLEEEFARYSWKGERPLYYKEERKHLLQKRKQMAGNLKKQFSKLVGAAPDAQTQGPSSFLFRWEEQHTSRICFHGHSLEGIMKPDKQPLSAINTEYWLCSLKKCKLKLCEHATVYEESNFPRSYHFVLTLFSFLLRVEHCVIHHEVCLIEEAFFKERFRKKTTKEKRKRKDTRPKMTAPTPD
ncbi:TATA box-binding protein-associated factor RNA polymerase I subunit B [Rhinophrynus dorsalis]